MRLRAIHTVTRWPILAADEFGSERFDDPAVFQARWMESTELQFGGDTQTNEPADVVLTKNREVNVGDYLLLGDRSDVSDPKTLPNAHRVKQVARAQSTRGDETWRKVTL